MLKEEVGKVEVLGVTVIVCYLCRTVANKTELGLRGSG